MVGQAGHGSCSSVHNVMLFFMLKSKDHAHYFPFESVTIAFTQLVSLFRLLFRFISFLGSKFVFWYTPHDVFQAKRKADLKGRFCAYYGPFEIEIRQNRLKILKKKCGKRFRLRNAKYNCRFLICEIRLPLPYSVYSDILSRVVTMMLSPKILFMTLSLSYVGYKCVAIYTEWPLWQILLWGKNLFFFMCMPQSGRHTPTRVSQSGFEWIML